MCVSNIKPGFTGPNDAFIVDVFNIQNEKSSVFNLNFNFNFIHIFHTDTVYGKK